MLCSGTFLSKTFCMLMPKYTYLNSEFLISISLYKIGSMDNLNNFPHIFKALRLWTSVEMVEERIPKVCPCIQAKINW